MKKLQGCKLYENICHYTCCNHESSDYFIWMYPGEYENSLKEKKHIEIIGNENGAKIGKCHCTNMQKKNCDGEKWFKPLDCWSYPFFPFIENGIFVLKVDYVRCPMAKCCDLKEEYLQLYNIWNNIILNNENVYHCIELIKMDNYKKFVP